MKTSYLVVVMAFFLLTVSSGCNSPQAVVEAVTAPISETETSVPVVTVVVPTSIPTPFPTPTEISPERARIREVMENYGVVDEKYLSDDYWNRLEEAINSYGPARRIVPLEFHGDYYSMFGGIYEMTPQSFETLMRYLMENDFHFVTGPELVGYLEGWLDLPSRSIILTSDSGATSQESFTRIIALFQELESEYGIIPHMLSFVWTQGMTPEESVNCVNDSCWNAFRTALASGYFTFGTHTETHRHFDEITMGDTVWDLTTSMDEIRENLGLNVYGISWPFENCSPYEDTVSGMGFAFAFGGWVRDTARLFVYQNDNMSLCLPRLFPPNTDGYSSRPNGFTIEDMVNTAANEYLPLSPLP